MTGETRKRIEYYQQILPGMKEKVFATAFTLLIAAAVTVTATYAWITLSMAPEVADITTTMASNGTLEIALSDNDGEQPDEFDFDEGIDQGFDVNSANLRWGNLINLSDSSYYGIDNLKLRPAQLNSTALLEDPLFGATYSADGRIQALEVMCTYAKWRNNKEFIAVADDYGVRAIASYTEKTSEGTNIEFNNFRIALKDAYTEVNNYYINNAMSKPNISGLGNVMSTYLQSMLNEHGYGTGDPNIPLSTDELRAVYNLYNSLYVNMQMHTEVLVKLANLQQYTYAKEINKTYEELTWDDLKKGKDAYDSAGTNSGKKDEVSVKDAISITGLKTFCADLDTAKADAALLKELLDRSNAGETIGSQEIDGAMQRLCNPRTAKIDGKSLDEWLAGSKFDLLDLTSGDHLATFADGILKRFEEMAIDSSNRLPNDKKSERNAANIRATAKYGISLQINMTGHLCTTAGESVTASNFMLDYSKGVTTVSAKDKVAQDTYGMAVDFWIRTNAEETYLILEGATTKDKDGNVLRYDGVNRVWGSTGNSALTSDSTTQGGGSCYVYYADSPEDVDRSLKLLKSMKIVFVSSDGKVLATAEMDTENKYAVNGRITVPLFIKTGEVYTYTNEVDEKAEAVAIRRLTMDNAERITAIIYLDGAQMDNTQVLSAAEIQGQLNLQFGSSKDLDTMGDSSLLMAERKVFAELTGPDQFEYAPDKKMETSVKVTVDGTQPEKMTGFFVRAINATQGSREKEMTFTKQADGTWTADYTFTAPGTYYLRYVQLDGVDYALDSSALPTVRVTGFEVIGVTWDEAKDTHTVYSTESSYSEKVNIKFANTTGVQPSSVKAKFTRDDGDVVVINAKLTGADTWSGTGSFTVSGAYTLSYVEVDGRTYDIGSYAKKLTLYLDLRAFVYNNNSSLTDKYDPDTLGKVYSKNVRVKVVDNAGSEIEGIEGVILSYSSGGSLTGGKEVPLTWNDATGYYDGTIPLEKPGRYVFYSLKIGSNTLYKATEAPVYIISSPDAPEYDTSSANEYNTEIQYVPLKASATTASAVLSKIKISNSAGALIKAVIYNDITKEYYTVQSGGASDAAGVMYYANDDNGDYYWVINVPAYEDEARELSVDGRWSVVCLQVSECFDKDGIYRDEKNPITWVGTSAEATAYKTKNKLTPDEVYDFSKLSSTASCKVNISMIPGITALGSKDAAFMSDNYIKDIGMSVVITDARGDMISKDYIDSVKVAVSYADNKDVASYGYEVAGYTRSFSIEMTQDAYGNWIPNENSGNLNWQYVGEYKVDKLTVKIGGNTKEFAPNTNGVPAMYTVTSKAPTADNLTITKLEQPTVEFGKDSKTGEVTGAFLAAYNPGVSVKFGLTPLDSSNEQHAMVPGITVKLDLKYQNGSEAPNGGYSWETGKLLGYETFTFDMTSTNGVFSTGTSTKVMLAGRYSLTGTMIWTENGKQQTKSIGKLKDIQVYSVLPEVKVTGVSPDENTEVQFNLNGDAADNHLVINAAEGKAYNRFADHYAVVYMQYTPYTTENNVGHYHGDTIGDRTKTTYSEHYADYTSPTVTLRADGFGEPPITMTIPGNGSNSTIAFEKGSAEKTIEVGYVEDVAPVHQEETNLDDFGMIMRNRPFTYKADKAYALGTQTITTVASTVNEITVTRELAYPITISQTHHLDPKLMITQTQGMYITVSDGNIQYNSGSMVTGATKLTVTATAENGYYNPHVTAPAGAMNWTVISETETKATYSFEMAFDDMTIEGSATPYPQLTYQTDYEKATLTITDIDGNPIPSGTGIKPGTSIKVTATATKGWYSPELKIAGAEATKDGDFVTTYTFNMPDQAYTLPTPSASAMYQITWQDTAAVKITAQVNNVAVSSGGYVIPGRTVIITLNASGGTDPELTQSPAGTEPYGNTEDPFIRQYKFTMPSGNVTLAASAKAYPELSFASDKAAVTGLYKDGSKVDIGNATEQGIKPGSIVKITLTAKEGYYKPRMTQPAGTTAWKVIDENNKTATYQFKMPNAAVTCPITATAAPVVTITGSNTGITISGKTYTNGDLTGLSVQPGTVVTVKATPNTGYHSPQVTATGATLTAGESGYDSAIYTFTMSETGVTLSGSAAADPTVTIGTGTGAKITAPAATAKIHPGTTVSVTVEKDGNYYNPTVSATGGVTLTEASTHGDYYDGISYTFTMGTQAVKLTPTAKAYPTITVNNNGKTTIRVNGSTAGSLQLRPGATATIESCTAAGNYTNASFEVIGATVSNSMFTMPTNNVTINGKADATVSWSKGGEETVTVTKVSGNGVKSGTNLTNGAIVNDGWLYIKVFYRDNSDHNNAYGYAENFKADNDALTPNNTNTSNRENTHYCEYWIQLTGKCITFVAKSKNGSNDSCVAAGTLITLADGTMVPVETLTGNEKLLIYDHEKGCYSTENINFIEVDSEDYYNVINLCFDNGVTSRVIYEHAFFDLDLMKYVYITEDSYTSYVGHRFYTGGLVDGKYVSGETVLAEAFITNERTVAYSLVTDYHLDYFTDGLLSIPGGIAGLFNIFEYDEGTLQYNAEQKQKDIETYGLCSYEEFKDVVSYDTFMKYPTIYFKVSIGKGIMTEEDLQYLIERYALRYNEPSATTTHVVHQQQTTVAPY